MNECEDRNRLEKPDEHNGAQREIGKRNRDVELCCAQLWRITQILQEFPANDYFDYGMCFLKCLLMH